MRKSIYAMNKRVATSLCCLGLLVCLSACSGNITGPVAGGMEPTQRTSHATPVATNTPEVGLVPLLPTQPQHPSPTPTSGVTPTPTKVPTATIAPSTPVPTQNPQPTVVNGGGNNYNGNPTTPLLAFYYTWYTQATWCSCHMSDLPTTLYNSSDDATIARQVSEASNAGINGFISSWWGPGDVTDKNFAKLLAHSATLQSTTGAQFDSTIYFESDAPALSGTTNIVNALDYVVSHYSSNSHFLHWHGKPVLFFWDPLGGGRTLAQWASIRSQVDPNNAMIWSAEGVSMSLLSVFDGIHLFSGGYWGILHGDMPTVDQGFRNEINTYNATNNTHKIWAAGVLPGYDDTRIPGRTGTYIVPRNNGATYAESWNGALSSQPDWVTITSFNEWFEGAMIEPSVTYGNLYLNLTRQYANQLHS